MKTNKKTKTKLISNTDKLKAEISKLKSLVKKYKETELKNTKERLLLRNVIDSLPDTIYVKDIKSRKLLANFADVRSMGVQSEAEVIGKDDFAFYPKDIADGFYRDDQSVINNGQPVINREEYYLDKGGFKHWLLTSKLPIWNDDGGITGIVGIGRNITERKNAERELQKRESQFKQLFENIAFGIAMCDKHENIVKVNAAFETIFQFSAAELMGKNLNSVVVPPHLQNEGNDINLQVSKNNVVIKETSRKRKDGSLIKVRIYGIPIFLDDKPSGHYGIYEKL